MPTITIELEEDVDRLVGIHKEANNFSTKQEAINDIVRKAKPIILKEIK